MWCINTHTLGTSIIWILTVLNFIAIIIIAIRWKWVELMREEIWSSLSLHDVTKRGKSFESLKNKSWISHSLGNIAAISAAYRAHLDKFHRKFKKNKHGYPEEIVDTEEGKWTL